MIIVNKNKTNLLNFEDITEISCGMTSEKKNKIFYYKHGNDKLYLLEEYETDVDAKIAMMMLCDGIGKTDKFIMPNKQQIKAYVAKLDDPDRRQASNGKKTVRRGGS